MFEKAYEKLTIKRVLVGIDNLPASFENFTIVHLSDVHINAKTPLHALEALVAKINTFDIDMIALTGDLFDASLFKIRTHLEILKQLKHPVYFVSGNHDLTFARKRLFDEVTKLGFILLDNQLITLERDGKHLQLLGLSDAFSRYFGLERHEKALFSKLTPHVPSILLAHQPKDIRFAKAFSIDLQLSGHTHGGQIYPFGYIVRLFQPYIKGLHKNGKTQIYVNTGYGSWGFNFRFCAPSEIAIIKLIKEIHAN